MKHFEFAKEGQCIDPALIENASEIRVEGLSDIDAIKKLVEISQTKADFMIRIDPSFLTEDLINWLEENQVQILVKMPKEGFEKDQWEKLQRLNAPMIEVGVSVENISINQAMQRAYETAIQFRLDPNTKVFPVYEPFGKDAEEDLRGKKVYCQQLAMWLNESMLSLAFQPTTQKKRILLPHLVVLNEALTRWWREDVICLEPEANATEDAYIAEKMAAYLVKLINHFHSQEELSQILAV